MKKKHKTEYNLIIIVVVIVCCSFCALGEFSIFSEYYDFSGHTSFFSPFKYEEIYSVYFKYNEKWIIGKTPQEIIERYGDFHSGKLTSTNVNGSLHYILVDHWAVKYAMYVRFEDNVAVEIYRDTLLS